MKHLTLLASAALLITGCASRTSTEQMRIAREIANSEEFRTRSIRPLSVWRSSKDNTVSHVVVCWLKHPGNKAEQQKLIDASYQLKDIPGVLHVKAGRAVPSKRPEVRDDFDAAVVIEFRDAEALANYQKHPTHVAAVKNVLLPLVKRLEVYDIR